jgi:hypothetical protein
MERIDAFVQDETHVFSMMEIKKGVSSDLDESTKKRLFGSLVEAGGFYGWFLRIVTFIRFRTRTGAIRW